MPDVSEPAAEVHQPWDEELIGPLEALLGALKQERLDARRSQEATSW